MLFYLSEIRYLMEPSRFLFLHNIHHFITHFNFEQKKDSSLNKLSFLSTKGKTSKIGVKNPVRIETTSNSLETHESSPKNELKKSSTKQQFSDISACNAFSKTIPLLVQKVFASLIYAVMVA